MAEPRRFLRFFEKITNVSVAASAEEDVIDIDFKGTVKDFYIRATADVGENVGSVYIKIVIDGNTIFNDSIYIIAGYYDVATADKQETVQTCQDLIRMVRYDKTLEDSIILFKLDSNVSENITISVTNPDAGHILAIKGSVIYDREI